MLGLAEQLGLRLRGTRDVCRAMTLTVRYADQSSTTRPPPAPQHSPAPPTTSTRRLGLQRARVTALSLRADGPTGGEHAQHQLLPDPDDDERRRIDQVADAARQKFGPLPVRPAALAPRPPVVGQHLWLGEPA
ncbi:hypothetical protein ACFYMW_09715 [Streptomyces sp. NPDC006692]|uniref:hypothetical protein n=1 Tax=Streptomyces sp. NPDC006692 TaxID=3364758 RepID=UPI0036C04AA4